MSRSSKRMICLHVNDACNFNCKNCHWFSEEVLYTSPPPVEDYLYFLNRFDFIDRLIFSGGEATLWESLAELVNNIPDHVQEVEVYTNGTGIKQLQAINCDRLRLRLSIHAQTSWDNVRAILQLAKINRWELGLYGFEDSFPADRIPKWLPMDIIVRPEQSAQGMEKFGQLVGHKIECQPRMLFIGTDGNAYQCERGLRSKSVSLRAGFGLTWGKVDCSFKSCKVATECVSAFETEQYIKHASKPNKACSAWSDFIDV